MTLIEAVTVACTVWGGPRILSVTPMPDGGAWIAVKPGDGTSGRHLTGHALNPSGIATCHRDCEALSWAAQPTTA